MKKAILIIFCMFLAVATFAQNTKKAKGKLTKSHIATPAPVPTAGAQPAHALYLSDGDLNEVFGSANAGFDKWILTTAIPANQIPQERQYFAGILNNILNQQKVWQKADADSIAKAKEAAKVDTTKKK